MRSRIIAAGSCLGLIVFFSFVIVGQAGSGARLTAKLDKKDIEAGRSTVVSGRLSDFVGGDSGQPLTVYAKPFPYDTEVVAGTTSTNPTGRYALRVKPRLNTRYVVRVDKTAPSLQSDKQPIAWVYPSKVASIARFIRPGKAEGRMILNIPAGHPYRLQGRPLFFYFRRKRSEVFERVARSRTRLASPGRIRGSAEFDIPRGKYTFFVSWCFNVDDRDVGLGRPVDPTCPRKRFRVGSLGKLADPSTHRPQAAAQAR